MDHKDTPENRALLASIDPMTLEVPILLTIDQWAVVLASMEEVIEHLTEGNNTEAVELADPVFKLTKERVFEGINHLKSALLETGKEHQYHILVIEKL